MCRHFHLSIIWITLFLRLSNVTTCMTHLTARNVNPAREEDNGSGEFAPDMDCLGQDQTRVLTFEAPWTNVSVPLPIGRTVDLHCFYIDCNPSQTVVVWNTTDKVISSQENRKAVTKRRFRKPQVVIQTCSNMGQYRCVVNTTNQGLSLTLLVQCPPVFTNFSKTVNATGGTAVAIFYVRSPIAAFPTCHLTFATRQTYCESYTSRLTVYGHPPDLTLRLTLDNLTRAESGNWSLAIANGFNGSARGRTPTTATATFVVNVAEGVTSPAKHDNVVRSLRQSPHLIRVVAPVCAAFIVVVIAAATGTILFRRAGPRRDKRPYIRLRGASLQDEIYSDIDAAPYDNPVQVVGPATPLLQLTDLSVHTHRQATSLCSLKTLADQSSHTQRWSSFPCEVTEKKLTVQPVRTAIRTPADQSRSRSTNVYQTSLDGKDTSKTPGDLPAAKEKAIDGSASEVRAFKAPWGEAYLQKVKDSRKSSVLAAALQEERRLCEIYGNEDVDDKDSRSASLGGEKTDDVYEIEDCLDARSSDTEGYYSNDSACPADSKWDQMEDVYENTDVLMGCSSSSQPDDVYGNIPQRPGDSDDYEVPVIPPTATSFARPDLADGRLNPDASRLSDACRQVPKRGVSLGQRQAGNPACRPFPARGAWQAFGKGKAATHVIRDEEGYIPMNPFP